MTVHDSAGGGAANGRPVSRLVSTALVVAAVLAAAGVWAVQLRGAEPAPPVQRPALTVEAAVTKTEDWPASVIASGVIAAWQDLVVSSRLSGTPLTALRADVGDVVRRGQVLALFDDAVIQAELAQAKASLAQAKANWQQAQANRTRALSLQGSGALSEQDVLQSVTQAAAAQAQADMASANVSAVQLKLAFTRVLAPDDGIVSARSASAGSVAQPGSELFRIIRHGRMEWRAELNTEQLLSVRPGLEARLKLPNGHAVAGRVRQIAPSLHPGSRLGTAYITLEHDDALRESMYASGEIITAVKPALTVPSEAVIVRDGRSYVFGIQNDRVSLTLVTTGRREGDRIELTSGVSIGQQVVARGAGFLAHNDAVRTVGKPAGAARS